MQGCFVLVSFNSLSCFTMLRVNSVHMAMIIAERLSARLLIVQCSRLAFVCMYIYMYIYPSHFNCVGAVSVVSSPYYEPRSTGLTTRRSRRDRARVEMKQARAT